MLRQLVGIASAALIIGPMIHARVLDRKPKPPWFRGGLTDAERSALNGDDLKTLASMAFCGKLDDDEFHKAMFDTHLKALLRERWRGIHLFLSDLGWCGWLWLIYQ